MNWGTWADRFPRAARALRRIDDVPDALRRWVVAQRDLARTDGWRAVVTPRRIILLGSSTLLLVYLGAAILTLPPALPDYRAVRAAYQPSEAWLYDRSGQLLDSSRIDYQARRLSWTPIEDIAPVVREVIVEAEDRRFASHGGIDWLAVAGSARARLIGERARGASTLSMQVAGYLAPRLSAPGRRGMLDKLRQMRAGNAIDGAWSKDEILEAYLNLAGFRGEAQGIGAAALALFGKSPAALTRDDAVLLAALLPDPRASAEKVAARACAIARETDCARFTGAAASMLGPSRRLAMDPGLAPHLSAKLLKQPGDKVHTTLDSSVQRMAITALRRQLQGLGGSRARDGAVVVVDNQSGDVLAYVGGIGGESTAPAVDGAASYRQAGSTLKPFLFALGIEKGYLTAASILDDSPVQLDTATGLYVPQNYDKAFKGPVSARIALAGSLNVPAVRTLVLTGVESFRDRLWDIGYRGLVEDGQYYGFSLALGSAEVTLMEQVAAFRSLALNGRWSNLRLLRDEKSNAGRQIISTQAAWIVSDMIADANARVVTFGTDSALRLPFWAAVKTGTSKAMRDNWCIGYSDKYTVGVWVGNLEGDPMRAVSGTSGAAPVWRDVMLALHRDSPGKPPARPDGIEERSIRFDDNLEQPRREFFVRGTGLDRVAIAPPSSRAPKIANPVSGSVYALDPDIPSDNQRLAVSVSGETIGHQLLLNNKPIGTPESRPMLLVPPGQHVLRLVDLRGKVVDQVNFTVR